MSTLENAIIIAARAHAGQVDKAGKPYILHPLRVMLSVSRPEERITAVLHDVIEYTGVTCEYLSAEGFPFEILEAIKALTKLDGEERIDAARRAAVNPIAREVKIADVKDNMDLTRIPHPTEDDYKRQDEYKEVLEYLQNYRDSR
ncbi:MAG TPA: hypothetical protein PK883_09825 [Anaerolineaceae bacterium]|nr:hypothetical protein [Anaerolineaceae bacterium]